MNRQGKKRLAIVGATGSIGLNALDIVRRYPDRFGVEVLTAGSRVAQLATLAKEFKPRMVVIADTGKEKELARLLEGSDITVASGSRAIAEACALPSVDMAVIASVGYSGLLPTVTAIRAGKEIALANKETLVVGGEYVMPLVREYGVPLVPIDSEHSAVAQCLAGENIGDVKRLIITASGGPFRNTPIQRLRDVTPEDALRHPNWSMGAKITIDSATMINKAFELIEARWLFGLPLEKITPIVHPRSIIHSMVEFTDGSIKAQMGVSDMRLPISYALGLGHRLPGAEQPLDLLTCGVLEFEQPDYEKFPCLTLAGVALDRGGNVPCIINAANEVAVASFLNGKITFTDIYDLIVNAIQYISFDSEISLENFQATDAETRSYVSSIISQNKI